jgi:hypothetical protein
MQVRDEIVAMLREQFCDEGALFIEIGKNLLNYINGDMIEEYSFILIKDRGIIYYNPERKECFYDGGVDGWDFYIIEHYRLKMNFRSLLPWRLEATLVEVFKQKEPKKLDYSEEVEKELFKL